MWVNTRELKFASIVHNLLVHDVYKNNFLADWQSVAKFRKPTIAAVSGYAVRNHPNTSSSQLSPH